MRKKPTVAQKTYCLGKKTATRVMAISNEDLNACIMATATAFSIQSSAKSES
jgi:hypothetical protein